MAAIRLSDEVTRRIRECQFVLSAFFTEGAEQVANLLLGKTQPNLQEGDEPPGFAGVIYALGVSLRAALDRMVSADVKLYAALAFEADLRKQRDDTVKDLAFQVVGMRRTVIGQYVEPDLDGLGLQPVDARDTVTVSRRVDLIDQRFQEDHLDRLLGKPRFKEPQNVRKLVSQMKTTQKDLDEILERINKAKRSIEWMRAHKHEMMGEYDQIFLPSARILEDFCRYVGKRDLADRIRRSVPNGRNPTEDDGDPGDPPVDQNATPPADSPSDG